MKYIIDREIKEIRQEKQAICCVNRFESDPNSGFRSGDTRYPDTA